MTEAIWTLDELTERVGAALSVGYDGQPSGRVRDLPDQRAIRWYTTIGLVDRPAATRGRTAMYGPRHLLQLVAIKRLQAQGRSLVAIQAELAGATDAQLARVAQVTKAPVPQARFWRERPVEAVGTAADLATLRGVRLGERATLLLDLARPLDDADLRAILDAAHPLLEALRARGLDHPGREHQ